MKSTTGNRNDTNPSRASTTSTKTPRKTLKTKKDMQGSTSGRNPSRLLTGNIIPTIPPEKTRQLVLVLALVKI